MSAARGRPPAYFRIAVLVGAAVLLLGATGIVWFDRGAVPTSRVSAVMLDIEPAVRDRLEGKQLTVEVQWTDAEGRARIERGTRSRQGELWLFRDAPEGRTLRVSIYEFAQGGTGKLIARTEGRLTRGGILQVALKR